MKCKIPERDLQARLDNTVCRYRGVPYTVRCVGANQLNLAPLDKDYPPTVIYANDEEFDISSVPLGFVQINKNQVCYISRRPARIYKQGLSPESVIIEYISKDARINNEGRFNIFTKPFSDMVLEKYPPLLEVLKGLPTIDVPIEVAVSRDVALQYDPVLKISYVYYKIDKVGFIMNGTKKVIVPTSEKAWVITNYLYELEWEVE
jgi:hypothetical protein